MQVIRDVLSALVVLLWQKMVWQSEHYEVRKDRPWDHTSGAPRLYLQGSSKAFKGPESKQEAARGKEGRYRER